ncbi:tetratricopeptide repeat protein [Botrimarina mediterranea]|uniref:Cellulose synthase subunit BcsC n=1 Tax=Botrimarina mediterranea TaxID=2528022 RepID=A0A518KEB8_9BACT|nr:tetratricopeptide repeat protein [Botrimarina mediterranea]QDV76137.1 cellulose synthase subunit BcsC [Botrimarina mediterranea]
MPAETPAPPLDVLSGRRLRLVGRFVGVSKREASAAVERRGGAIDDAAPDLVVIGEAATTADRERAVQEAAASGAECWSESELWRQLGLVEADPLLCEGAVRRLYSPAMLADLVGAPLAAVQRWARRGVIRPACWVQRLAYFDFEEARVAQLLSDLLREGRSLAAIDSVVDRLAAAHPAYDRAIAELPLVIEGGELLVRGEAALRDVSGQRRFDFDEVSDEDATIVLRMDSLADAEPTTQRERAWRLHDEGTLDEAIDAWRLAMLESPPTAEDHFVLADWLYAAGQSVAARERYYAALELDPEHLEARVNLGCVLSDLGEHQLAVAAVRGALDQHEAYADAHFHLARICEKHGDHEAAAPHWRRFLEIAPESPWAEEARDGLRWVGSDSQS